MDENKQKKNYFDFILNKIISVIFGVIFLLTVFQVLSRFIFFFPAPWVEELISFFFVWMVFLGSGLAQINGEHSRVELIPMTSKGRLANTALIVGHILTIFFLAIVVIKGTSLVILTMPMPSLILGLPMGIFYLSAPVGGLIMLSATGVKLLYLYKIRK